MAATLRPPADQDARGWTREVFARGDYAGAAMFGDAATWQCHAARALVRGDEPAFAALAQWREPEARFHAAAARFVHGDTARAQRELVGIDLPHARNLAAMLARGRIRVLAQLPWCPGAMTDLPTGARSDALFDLRQVSHRTGDVPHRPYANVADWCDGAAPDFYVATMVEWHHLPPDLQTLPCPVFGHLADHDLHIQTITPWLDLFDELCVTDRSEWLDVQGLARGVVSSFPSVFGLPRRLPPVSSAARHLDFFVSGTMLDPWHPDKARLLQELLAMPDIALRVVRGHTGPLAFYALLAASKASFTYVRRPGAMPTRGLESLAMGCAVALQEESILNLWVGADEGAVTYGPGPGELAGAVRRILDDWREFGPAACRGAALVREQFAMARVASRYLRFLAFRAAMPRQRVPRVDTADWCQKRLCISRAWLPDHAGVRRRTMQANFRHLAAAAARRRSPRDIVDMARELLCEFAFYADNGELGADEGALRDDALRLLERCERLFPRHLAARFLRIRALWHHGDAEQRTRALQLAEEVLAADPSQWQLEPVDDVMPFDFHAACFNYRDYCELLAADAKGHPAPRQALVHLVLAAIAGYVARERDEPSWHERVVAFDPAFARYRLDLAACLLRRGDAAQRQRAFALLQQLADGSTEFATASRLLVRHRADLLPAAGMRSLRALEQHTIDAGISVRALFAKPSAPARPASGGVVAVLVPYAGSARELGDLLADLAGQTLASRLEIEIVVALTAAEAATTALPPARERRIAPVAAEASFATRLNACVQAATAASLIVAMPGDRFRADALEVLQRELDEHSDAELAFASEGWTTAEVARFEPGACVGFASPPPFAERRLATTDGIGHHAMWRRALHARHGGFDASYGAAAEYEFWLRVAPHTQARQLPQVLSTSCVRARWRPWRDAASDLAAVERARTAHGVGTSPAFTPRRLLPSWLSTPGISEEARSHARLGILTDDERRDLESLEQFQGTALMHNDVETAICLLRAAVASTPQMLAPQLALADLLEALGRPWRDVVERAQATQPYAALLAARLARAGPCERDVVVPQPDPVPEAPPCPR